jgi:hypothetical protein
VPHKFSPGDLVVLNDYGIFIGEHYKNSVGVIISPAYSIVPQIENEMSAFYIVYDILLDAELIKMIPQEFMEFYKENEKDIK